MPPGPPTEPPDCIAPKARVNNPRFQPGESLDHVGPPAAGADRCEDDLLALPKLGAISPEQGLMNDSVPEILTDRALRRMSRSVVVLADASKFEQVAPAPTLAALRKQGVEVEVAPDPDQVAAAAPAALAPIREPAATGAGR